MTDSQLQTQLDRARKELLDLTGRNRLLNTPRRKSRGKALEIVDELSDEIFRILFADGKRMAFLAAAESEEPVEPELAAEPDALGQPEEDEDLDERGVAARHTDTKLQTSLDDVKLQKKLLSLFYDARTAEEEQGVNILYLALGFLEWYEVDHSDRPRYAQCQELKETADSPTRTRRDRSFTKLSAARLRRFRRSCHPGATA